MHFGSTRSQYAVLLRNKEKSWTRHAARRPNDLITPDLVNVYLDVTLTKHWDINCEELLFARNFVRQSFSDTVRNRHDGLVDVSNYNAITKQRKYIACVARVALFLSFNLNSRIRRLRVSRNWRNSIVQRTIVYQ